jgi:glycosyltransferase involved in cell wall biosynthesis
MNSESQPLVSVVTPVYNAEPYLAECIESILAQTYENWEYVIVNNCSTDHSLEIAQHYAQQDARIRIHDNKDFLNQMQNWNHAMRQISPESRYCKVVHADDWLFPECVSRMVEVTEASPSVGIVGAYRLDENRVNLDKLPYPSTVVSGREICRLTLLGQLYVFGSPTSLLIRSDFVHASKAFYDESIIQADKKVCFDILQHSDFGFVHQVLTYTRRHNDSMTSMIHRFQTRRLGTLIYLKRYGPIFLSKEEYERRFKQVIKDYYEFLGRNVFELRSKAFWEYHKDGLRTLGHPLSLPRLIQASFLELINLRESARRISHARRAIQKRRRQNKSQEAKNAGIILGQIFTQNNGDAHDH